MRTNHGPAALVGAILFAGALTGCASPGNDGDDASIVPVADIAPVTHTTDVVDVAAVAPAAPAAPAAPITHDPVAHASDTTDATDPARSAGVARDARVPASIAVRFAEARELHLRAVAGAGETEESGADASAAERSLEMLAALAADRTAVPILNAYLGSARILEAERTRGIAARGRLVQRGLGLLDEAVEAAPDDLEIRFLRGASTRPLPFFFGRGGQSADDLDHVVERLANEVEASRLDPVIARAARALSGD